MTPAAVPGVINHRAGWWLRWDSITVSKFRRDHSNTEENPVSTKRRIQYLAARKATAAIQGTESWI
jgi:predicted dithiol-disulfide oxidoreductase (DUF899 family)